MDLESAIAKHAEWKVKLRSAIAKKEQLDALSISKDDRCDLGKWLHGEGKAKFSKLASYAECLAKHASFHVEAGKVAAAINQQRYEEAKALMDAGTSYAKASGAVATAIMSLKREAGL